MAKGVGFTNLKIDEYEKDQCEKDAIFGTLQNDLKSVSMKVEDLKKRRTGKNNALGEIVF